jgi:hypothetical protein
MKSEPRLTIEFGDGPRVDEYRIREQQVEFRPRLRNGAPLPDRDGRWRRLTAEDISMHQVLHTVVAEWLKLRLLRAARGR